MIKLKTDIKKSSSKGGSILPSLHQRCQIFSGFPRGFSISFFHQGDQVSLVFPPRGSSISSFFQGGKVYHPFCKETKFLLFFPKPRGSSISFLFQEVEYIILFLKEIKYLLFIQGGPVNHVFSKEVKLLLFLIQEGAL